jgi:alcohol dehydrogenase (cytochrome c)
MIGSRTTRLLKCLLDGTAALVCAGVLGTVSAYAADEVTQDRLLNADTEPGNWILHHKNFFGPSVLQPQ